MGGAGGGEGRVALGGWEGQGWRGKGGTGVVQTVWATWWATGHHLPPLEVGPRQQASVLGPVPP